jgi:F-type H+-transporting ATPase subunit epsilon
MSTTPHPEPTLQSAVEHSLMPSEATELADSITGRVRCTVVTPEKAVVDETVEMVILPMIDGELGVLPGRSPIIGRLGAGELRLKNAGTVKRYFVEAGFVQVQSNVVTVLTAKAQPAEEITAALAESAATEAAALPTTNPVERANKTKARDRAAGLKKVVGKNAALGIGTADIISPGSHATA